MSDFDQQRARIIGTENISERDFKDYVKLELDLAEREGRPPITALGKSMRTLDEHDRQLGWNPLDTGRRLYIHEAIIRLTDPTLSSDQVLADAYRAESTRLRVLGQEGRIDPGAIPIMIALSGMANTRETK